MSNLTEKLRYSKGYVDESMSVSTFNDLLDIPTGNRFAGLTVTVLNFYNGMPADFWLVGGTAKKNWRLKSVPQVDAKSDLDNIKNICVFSNLQGDFPLIDDGFIASTKDGDLYSFKSSGWELYSSGGGEPGSIGPTGPQGIQGRIGPTGVQGAKGPTGEKGPVGPTGKTGNVGPTGAQGEQGPIGPTGAQGEQGEVGPTGAQGAKGPTGEKGANGPTGAKGEKGEIGPTGAQGAVGPTGAKGEQGEVGPTGAQGEQGEVGPTGAQGEQGPIGPTGAQGEQGEVGPTGAQGEQGPIGPTGAQGEVGPTGAQGEIGPTGPKGEDGTSVKILGTLNDEEDLPSSGDNGDGYIIHGDLWVYNNGNWTNVGPIIGPIGPTGAQGEQGPIGPTGVQGEVGPTGAQGEQGPIGPTGAQGEQGEVGPTGAQGEVGPTGAHGEQGPIGPTGAQGEQGPIGPTGAQGEQGEVGPTGAQGEQGEVGPTGAQGEQGPIGPTGAQGEQGPIGPTGAQGEQGPIGPTGIQGEIGPTGAQGEQGPIGPTGAQGEQGEVGPTGAQGEQGPIGPTGVQGEQGEIGPTGAQGEQGPIGPTGSQGEQGPIGPTGAQGEIGPTGPKGEDGGSSEISQDILVAGTPLANLCVQSWPTDSGWTDLQGNNIIPSGITFEEVLIKLFSNETWYDPTIIYGWNNNINKVPTVYIGLSQGNNVNSNTNVEAGTIIYFNGASANTSNTTYKVQSSGCVNGYKKFDDGAHIDGEYSRTYTCVTSGEFELNADAIGFKSDLNGTSSFYIATPQPNENIPGDSNPMYANDGSNYITVEESGLTYSPVSSGDFESFVLYAASNMGHYSNEYSEDVNYLFYENLSATAHGTKNSYTVTGYRKYFYGLLDVEISATSINNNVIRGLNGSNGPANGNEWTLNIVSGKAQVIIAVPSVQYSKMEIFQVSINDYIQDLPTSHTRRVMVAGANGYKPVEYVVWSYAPAAPFPANDTYRIKFKN